MLAQIQGIALAHHHAAVNVVRAVEILHHGKGLGRGNHGGTGIDLQKSGDVGGVIRLHVVHHQIVRLAAAQSSFDIAQPLVAEALVHRVHDGNFLIDDGIGIVGHSVGHHILPLKQVDLMVIDTDVTNVFCNVHTVSPLSVSMRCVFAGGYFTWILYHSFRPNTNIFLARQRAVFGKVPESEPRLVGFFLLFWKFTGIIKCGYSL